MQHFNFQRLLILGFLLLFSFTANCSAETETETALGCFKVLYVVDGDTFDADLNRDGRIDKNIERIRVLGIDTFEYFSSETVSSGHYRTQSKYSKLVDQAETYDLSVADALERGQISTAAAKRLMLNRNVCLTASGDQLRGYYGRLLTYVTLPDGQDWGEMLLSSGLAYVYRENTSHARFSTYDDAAILQLDD
jgi:endonuclease YncB( thermonuclease family)